MFFFKQLASTWIGPKICGSLKNKVQILQIFYKYLVFFQGAPQYWHGEHSNIMFLVNRVCFPN